MPWFKACLCRSEKRRPRISPPLHLLIQNGAAQDHCFRAKTFKKARPCHVCHQPIHTRGSVCRVCKYVCHTACESKGIEKQYTDISADLFNQEGSEERYADTSVDIHANWALRHLATFPLVLSALSVQHNLHRPESPESPTPHSNERDGPRSSAKKKSPATVTPVRPSPKMERDRRTAMDLSYVTERIIALWFPDGGNLHGFREGHHQAAHMLTTKHADNYMVFNLSEPRRAIRSQHERVREVGWPPGIAPPLERLCSICKDIETWLGGGNNRIAVIHAKGSRERVGVVIAAFMHYSSICGTADQALDRFAMRRYLDDKVGEFDQPSHKRYIDYFSGLLSGNIRVNSSPLYLTHITVLGAPNYESGQDGVSCRAFLKIYEGLVPVYTSGVHRISPGCRQFVVNVAADRSRQGLPLHGDILVKCYHRMPRTRELVFAFQFHTCAISDYTISLTRNELDSAVRDLRFPLDGAVSLHFSPSASPRQPSPAPTPAVPVDMTDDAVVRWDSYADLANEAEHDSESDGNEENPEVAHTYGPLDGSIYATVAKKASPVGPEPTAVTISSPRTVSMDSGISSAGNGLQNLTNASNASSTSPAPQPPTSQDSQRALDELLREMLVTVESIADVVPPTPRTVSRLSSSPALDGIAYIDEPEEIPYHARTDSRPFTYGVSPEMLRGQTGLSSPSLVRKASFGKSNGYADAWKSPKSADSWTSRSDSSWTTTTPRTTRSWENSQNRGWDTTPRNTRSWENNSTGESNRWKQNVTPVRKSYDTHDGVVSNGSVMNGNMTWLQRQQQKLRERRENSLRSERRHQELRLISELRSHNRPSASHRDGYTSDTTQFADDDDDDVTLPLHVQISLASPSRTHNVQERPFVAVKRAHEANRNKQFIDSNLQPSPEAGLLSLVRSPSRQTEHNQSYLAKDEQITRRKEEHITQSYHSNNEPITRCKDQHLTHSYLTKDDPMTRRKEEKFNQSYCAKNEPITRRNGDNETPSPASDSSFSHDALSALIATLGGPQKKNGIALDSPEVEDERGSIRTSHGMDTPDCNSNLTNTVSWSTQVREDSVCSWRTASVSDDPGSPSRTNSPRPVTPAFPVHPRTPYINNTVHFELNGLPPKSPTAQRRNHNTVRSVRRSPSSSSKDRSPSPNGLENIAQYSPKSTSGGSMNGYQTTSQRSSVHSGSGSEPPQDVPAAQVKFVKDTSRYWYKPSITREEAIAMLRNESPGTFVVRDSNSFPGAFGLAVKVSTPPPGKTGTGPDELIRHFLIEPTSRGVRLKGCANEPVFSTLSALVYQHSITHMALPTRLVLPQGDRRVEPLGSSAGASTAQQLLTQGAACNVLYLVTVDMESLTGPQAIRKAVEKLFHSRPLPLATIVHFKVSGQGITLTDNKRQLFFRRHYPVAAISHCGLDPEDHRWNYSADVNGLPNSSHRCFGFVARKPASKTDNQCHVFAELEPEQPASAIVNFVSKVMMTGSSKPNIV